MTRYRLLAALVVATWVAPPTLADADEPAARATAPDADALARAKDLFRKGLALLDAGDVERALDYFLRSRALVASSKNTANAAVCLDRLGRYDEALEMYEELLTRFSGELDDQDRSVIGPAMAALRQKVGSIEIASNVEGAVVIDGRPRGKLPTPTPIRVIGGKHVVRVMKDGYAPFEKTVDVTVGQTVTVDARLAPLSGVGVLRVEDPTLDASEVFVDGVRVGVTPWEGTLGPGKHVVWTRKGERGSAPSAIRVLEGQTALSRVSSGALGPPMRVDVEPATAEIALDAVTLGVRAWEGRLPVGHYTVTASEPGYTSRASAIDVGAGAEPIRVRLRLEVDPTHPRWPRARLGQFFVAGFGAFLRGGTFHSDAERVCPGTCSPDPAVSGYLVGLRGGYRFEAGLALELMGGYLWLRSAFTRTLTDRYRDVAGKMHTVTYELDDDLRLRGPFAGAGVSYALRLGRHFAFVPRTAVGLVFAEETDPITGTARTSGDATQVNVSGRTESLRSLPLFVMPELGGEAMWGALRAGVAIGAAFFPGSGPAFGHDELGVQPSCDAFADAGSIGCAPNSGVVAHERAHGPFAVFAAGIAVSYAF